jgi:hypothetical protein
MHGPASDQELALVGNDDATDDLAESRFSGAVLTDERVHRTRGYPYPHRLECARPSIVLADTSQLDVGVAVRLRAH